MWHRTWSVEDIVEQLHALGIHEGDRLFVHTSLRATRLRRAEVPRLWDAYQQTVGEAGGVFFPTHTYHFKGVGRPGAYSVDSPCSPLIGAWPELARKLPGVMRSLHPTHSAAGAGAGAVDILAGHDRVNPVGRDSPLDRLMHLGGKVMLVGCGFESCTILHLAETYANVPYIHVRYADFAPAGMLSLDGEVVEVPITETPGCSRGFRKFEPHVRRRGLIQDGRIAGARTMVCGMRAVVETAAELLLADPFGFLCRRGICTACDERRWKCKSLER